MQNLLSTRVWQAVDRQQCRVSWEVTRVWKTVMAGKSPISHCMKKMTKLTLLVDVMLQEKFHDARQWHVLDVACRIIKETQGAK